MPIDRTQYNLLSDDSGAGTDGTVVDKNKIKVVILDPIDALIADPLPFTPTIVSSGGGTPTYSVQVGRYQRSNGIVQVTGRITLATFGTLAAGTITIGGLPVVSANVSNIFGPATIPYWVAMTTAVVGITGYVPPNNSAITLHIVTAATTTMGATTMTKADLSATSDLLFSARYFAT